MEETLLRRQKWLLAVVAVLASVAGACLLVLVLAAWDARAGESCATDVVDANGKLVGQASSIFVEADGTASCGGP